jgi:cell division protein FtsQ
MRKEMESKGKAARRSGRSSAASVAAAKRSRVARARRRKPSSTNRKRNAYALLAGEGKSPRHPKSEGSTVITEPSGPPRPKREPKRVKPPRRLKKDRPRKNGDATATEVDRGGDARVKRAGRKLVKNKVLRLALLSTAFIASLALLLWTYTGTGVLNVAHVEVRGNEMLNSSYVKELSGITADTHLMKMDVGAVERALCTEPYIAGVEVSRRFPNTVVLDIEEREPIGIVYQNEKYSLVDREGMVLECRDEKPDGLAEIEITDIPLLFPGREIEGDDFEAVCELIGSMPVTLRDMTRAVGLLASDGLYLESEGTRVVFGGTSDLKRKSGIALLALTGLVQNYRSVEYIDVSLPDHPVIKPVK